jgi:phosphatidylinositol alpha-1,6-mannosyltransferase
MDTMDVSREQIRVIHPSISVPSDIPSPNPDGPVFTLARLVERKNVDNLIRGWKLLPESLRQKHGLFIGGDGEERPKLEKMADEDPTIRIMGRVSEEKKQQMLSEASLFALTPLRDGFDVEGFGIVYIEAQSYGTPVIGSSTGGVPEAVGDTGELINDPTDHQEIASGLKNILRKNTKNNQYYNNIRNRIFDFNIKNIAIEHTESYNELVEHQVSVKR